MPATVSGTHGSGNHAGRPAGNAVPDGSLYSCTTHSLIYVSSYAGNSWSTWASLTGTGLSDPLTTRGDVMVRDASNVTARLAIGAAGKVLRSDGTDLSYQYPPGYEFDHAQITSSASITATTEAGADTVVAGNSVTYDGSTVVLIEFSATDARPDTGASGRQLIFALYDGAGSIGQIGFIRGQSTTGANSPVRLGRRLTPSGAAHTYTIKAFVSAGTGSISAGSGGSGAGVPAFMRITKV